MARPGSKVLLEHTDSSYRKEQILEADAIYAVFYQGQPFNLKSFSSIRDDSSIKYKKTSFSNPAHCIRLAERLNQLFKTDEFVAVKMTDGSKLEKEDSTRDRGVYPDSSQKF